MTQDNDAGQCLRCAMDFHDSVSQLHASHHLEIKAEYVKIIETHP